VLHALLEADQRAVCCTCKVVVGSVAIKVAHVCCGALLQRLLLAQPRSTAAPLITQLLLHIDATVTLTHDCYRM
jgi:hypothetical protein